MLTCENGTYSVQRWDKYKPVPFSPIKSVDDARDELLELYKQSVKRHLLSDVPLGLLLSGGVDSSVLLALMNLNGESWRTYTVGYGSSFAHDELADAIETACHFSSRHASVKLDRKTFDEALPKIVACLEEPIASSSIVPMYFVCQRARQDVKVVLMGQGPDELFGGYRRHLGVRYGALWASLPPWLRGAVASGVEALPRNETLKRGVYSLDIPERLRRYQHVLSLMPGDKVDCLFHDGILGADTGDKILTCWQDLAPLITDTDELGGFQFLELRSTLPDELLMYADKLSMTHGLEVRVPYLDRAIVEYVERLSANFKVRNGSRKWLHRKVCQRLLPKSVLQRKKRGFAVNVVDDWFRDAMRDKIEEILHERTSRINEFLRPTAVREMLKRHQSGHSDNHKILFSLVVFEHWLRIHGSLPRVAA